MRTLKERLEEVNDVCNRNSDTYFEKLYGNNQVEYSNDIHGVHTFRREKFTLIKNEIGAYLSECALDLLSHDENDKNIMVCYDIIKDMNKFEEQKTTTFYKGHEVYSHFDGSDSTFNFLYAIIQHPNFWKYTNNTEMIENYTYLHSLEKEIKKI
jgi:hypothetical protein